jgi:hypothetical protein
MPRGVIEIMAKAFIPRVDNDLMKSPFLRGLASCLPPPRLGQALSLLLTLTLSMAPVAAEDTATKGELQMLRQQNELMQQQMKKQQEMIDSLARAVSELKGAKFAAANEPAPASVNARAEVSPLSNGPAPARKVSISGQGALVFLRSEADGKFPKGTMRVDEAKLFVEAPVWNDTYAFAELNVVRREDPDDKLNAGELYLDFENISRWWGRDGQLNLRLGRLDIPFGEEYLSRDASDNPTISHSLADFWGVDEGVEIYGKLGEMQYVLAVQNGGHPSLYDYNSDKSVTVRLGYDPAAWLHLGLSGMRTGRLDAQGDRLSELWFGDGFVRSLGSPQTTTTFQANLFQVDAMVTWRPQRRCAALFGQ